MSIANTIARLIKAGCDPVVAAEVAVQLAAATATTEHKRAYDQGYASGRRSIRRTIVAQPIEIIETQSEPPSVDKRNRIDYSEAFSVFWKGYPTTPMMSKKQTFAEWKKLSDDNQAAATASLPVFRDWISAHQKKYPGYYTLHACRFLSQGRYDGFQATIERDPGVLVKPEEREWKALEERYYKEKGKYPPINRDGGWRFPSDWLSHPASAD